MEVVNDETVLSTLTGVNGEYRLLVGEKFRTKYGNVTWKAARLMTKDQFLKLYSAGETPAVWNFLSG
jgi:hypothetical protein